MNKFHFFSFVKSTTLSLSLSLPWVFFFWGGEEQVPSIACNNHFMKLIAQFFVETLLNKAESSWNIVLHFSLNMNYTVHCLCICSVKVCLKLLFRHLGVFVGDFYEWFLMVTIMILDWHLQYQYSGPPPDLLHEKISFLWMISLSRSR